MNEVPAAQDISLESLVAQLADEFRERLERGERPAIEEHIQRHPQHAGVIRNLLTSLEFMRLSAPVSSGMGAPFFGDIEPGAPLGDYRLIREIGRGGMGVVYEAEQLSLARRVALKVLPYAGVLDPRQLQRFKNEAQAAACLHHSNIVPIHFVGCERGVHFYAMQLVEGTNLAELIRQLRQQAGVETPPRHDAPPESSQATTAYAPASGTEALAETAACAPLSTEGLGRGRDFYRSVAQLGVQAAEALDHAHQAGVVHRDVKPANLMLDRAGRLWVTDFGLALLNADAHLTLTGDLVGTLRYMSPEQALAQRVIVDHRTDIYSLGATLYELLTLQPAFPGNNRQELLRQIAFEEPRRPRRWNKSVPAELETIVLKALEKNPPERYATAGELADDLERFLKDEPIWAKPPTFVSRVRKWSRRHKPVLTALLAVTAVAVLSLLAGAVWFTARLQDQRDKAVTQEKVARQENENYRHALYAAHLQVARREWEGNRIRAVLELLDGPGCPPDLRGWEWHYLRRLCHQELHTFAFPPEGNPSGPLIFTPNGRLLAGTKPGRTFTLWDVASGQVVRRLAQPLESHCTALSPDSRLLASGDMDWVVRVWDVAGGQEVFALKGHTGPLIAVAFSPDGRLLASAAHDSAVRVWDLISGQPLFTFSGHTKPVYQVAFSPDGRRGASASVDGIIKVWDATGGQGRGTLVGHADVIYGLAFSPDGRLLASTSRDNTVRLWDVAGLQGARTLAAPSLEPGQTAFSPDGRLLAVCGEGAIRLWDVISGEEVRTLKGHFQRVNRLVFSPDGLRLASIGQDKTVKVWDLRNGPREFRTVTKRNAGFLLAGQDGGRLGTQSQGGPLTFWDVASLEQVRASTMPPQEALGMALSPDGRLLAMKNNGHALKLWDLVAGREIHTLTGNARSILRVVFSPNNRLLAAAGDDVAVRLWDVASGREIGSLAGHAGFLQAVAFSPDSLLLASASKQTVTLWDVASRQVVRILAGHTGTVSAVAFSPDGRLLASSSHDWTVKLWDVAEGQERFTLTGHSRVLNAVAFSPDGRRLASAGHDNCVKLWDVASGQEVLTLGNFGSFVHQVAFTADGHRLVTAGGDGVRLWDAAD